VKIHIFFCLLFTALFGSEFSYYLDSFDEKHSQISLNEGGVWEVGYWYLSVVSQWDKGDQIDLSYGGYGTNTICFTNQSKGETAWGKLHDLGKGPLLLKRQMEDFSKESLLLVFSNGAIFKAPKGSYQKNNPFVFFKGQNPAHLWDVHTGAMFEATFLGFEQDPTSRSILHLEQNLKKEIIGQDRAVETVTSSIYNKMTGLCEKDKPVGVFLFIGSTGVGKTALCKALTEYLYNNPLHLTRFDMCHFNSEYTITRLIGSSPGYVDSDKGGQLSNALMRRPQSIILLDEMEKAHDEIRKFFLPIFDEGSFCDARDRPVHCQDAIFVMTTNICSSKVYELALKGLSQEEILSEIEPELIKNLSPELYARVEPVIFNPITQEVAEKILAKELTKYVERLKKEKEVTITIDDSLLTVIKEKAFSNELGVRPLKKWIEKLIVRPVSKIFIFEEVTCGNRLILSWDEEKSSVAIEIM
jgi:ATP-dependent Clp protease ATP-binding subunit ClpB